MQRFTYIVTAEAVAQAKETIAQYALHFTNQELLWLLKELNLLELVTEWHAETDHAAPLKATDLQLCAIASALTAAWNAGKQIKP